MWVTAFSMAGFLWLLVYLQMANNQENAVATLLIESPEELNDNITTDQFSEDNETSKNNDDEVALNEIASEVKAFMSHRPLYDS